ncbi:MAG: hypothetical protein GQF41_0224 [Candidatus Rifleibacterium amylolyticum]|nr:MAG: hypothetical protein GQF41_0224 [Candidatus Rifleibacterium amylolyticum]
MIKKHLPVLLFSFLLAMISCQSFANEWVDMGPLQGSVEGHVWSKVVDEVGNTQGRNEIWQLSLPCPVLAEIIVKCPDPYPLEVAVDYTHDWHGTIQLKPERTSTGFYTKEIALRDPERIKKLRISVYSRKPATDQRYQLIVNLTGLDGKPLTAAAPASPAPKDKVASAAKTSSNLALGKPATQSSTYAGTGVDQGPQHAVDGITSGRDPHDLIHTNYEKNPWWRVDLGVKSAIEKIKIYNRTNPEVKSNLSLELLVSDDGQNWQSVYTHDNEVFQMLAVPLSATGRHVMARLNSERDALQLYEIEVIGRPLP